MALYLSSHSWGPITTLTIPYWEGTSPRVFNLNMSKTKLLIFVLAKTCSLSSFLSFNDFWLRKWTKSKQANLSVMSAGLCDKVSQLHLQPPHLILPHARDSYCNILLWKFFWLQYFLPSLIQAAVSSKHIHPFSSQLTYLSNSITQCTWSLWGPPMCQVKCLAPSSDRPSLTTLPHCQTGLDTPSLLL